MGKPNKYDGMMHDYCVMHGWCGGVVNGEALHVSDFIPEQGIVSADQFVTWLMKAEGANPSDLAVRAYFICQTSRLVTLQLHLLPLLRLSSPRETMTADGNCWNDP